ncbi:MAG: hypothetical protein KDC88_03280 [Ignavibacteriae bacterium]|nr:hypothetical protein [Ignavibacteriota bacterium]MCB9209184.1 hypothetical protein [Ignavibacteriales bacterium]MCB9219566.1 hypothetical protein [Ignavibacteriales bacterium]MCB9257832.1 hypothetical protein [Ignavibacteriales bacterium]
MKLLAIPNFGERISPRLDYAESLHLITVEENSVIKKETIKIIPHNLLDRINLIIGLKPNVVICDGLSDLIYNKLTENKIEVIPWIHGSVNEIIEKYLNGDIQVKATKI